MSLMGVDVGTTGCKASVFSVEGATLSVAYREYDILRPQPGCAELDAAEVWARVREVIAESAAAARTDPVTALSVSSLGEAVVPVDEDRRILGPSILNFDERGAEYLEPLDRAVGNARLYQLNGNTLGNQYGLTKLMWLRDHQPDLYARTYKVLLWGSFVCYMLGADPVVDYSLANRTLLFDLDREDWSDELLEAAGLDRAKLPGLAPSGTAIGVVSDSMASALGLPPRVAIVTGAHDQCANAVGCGVLDEGRAMLGLGTYICAVPVYRKRPAQEAMVARGLNTEHHAAPGRFVSFIFNQAGSIVKWYRDTFAALERDAARREGRDIYDELLSELPEGPGKVLVLPHFAPTGPPEFVENAKGVMVGLKLDSARGDILRGIIEGSAFYVRETLDALPEAGIHVRDFRAVGGGSKSDAWLQACADIFDRPLTRACIPEAGTLGGAILAGAATDVFDSVKQGADTMVRLDRTFEPDRARRRAYDARYEQYHRLWPLMRDYLAQLD